MTHQKRKSCKVLDTVLSNLKRLRAVHFALTKDKHSKRKHHKLT